MTSDPVNSAGASHRPPPMWFDDDVLCMRIVGEIGLAEMRMMIDMTDRLLARHGYILVLADAKQATGVHRDARKLQAERAKRPMGPNHAAAYNINGITRTVATLMQQGISLITGKSYPISFHRDEAEARVTLAKVRAGFKAAAGGGAGES